MHPFIRSLVLQAPLLLALAACGSDDQSAELPDDSALRAWNRLASESAAHPRIEWDGRAGVAREVAGSFPLRPTDVSEAASSFLLDHAEVFGVRPGDMQLTSVRESLVGWHIRFDQRASGRKVHGVEVAVHVERSPDGMRAFLVRSGLVPRLVPAGAQGSDAKASARALELAAGLGLRDGVIEQITPVVLQDGRAARQVDIRGQRPARLLRLVVADDGSLADAQELLKSVDGTGWVFDPNPVAATGDFALADQGNADSPALTGARIQVTLQGLDGTGRLSGPYVDAFNSLNMRATVPSLVFDYTRSNDFFEEVMAYYHIDRAQRRLQSLGFAQVVNWPLAVQVNGKAQDNSWYDTKKNMIMFGSGGVDDAEDADIILHEYGHAILWDQVPGFGAGSQAGAIDEGFCDFHAAMSHSMGTPIQSDLACIGPWDATSYSPPPCLRRTDSNKHFPEFMKYDVHDDADMWSSALFEASGTVGALEMLRIVVESNFLLSPSTSFQQASDAVLLTDQMIAAGAHQELLRRTFTWRGLSRTKSPAYTYSGPWESHSTSVASAQPYSNLQDKWVDIHHAGASAIRVHFAQFSTQQGYDHVYLYDPEVHLYAIYTGALGAFTSVAVPGDTVRVRLVSDSQLTSSGYAIDSYEVPGSNTDAAAPDSALPDAFSGDAMDSDGEPDGSAESGVESGVSDDASSPDASEPDAASLDDAPLEGALQDGASGGASGDGAALDSDAGVDESPLPASAAGEEGGCGCRVGNPEGQLPRTILALSFLGLLGALRRRRITSPSRSATRS